MGDSEIGKSLKKIKFKFKVFQTESYLSGKPLNPSFSKNSLLSLLLISLED